MPDGGQIVIAAREESISHSNGNGLKPGCYIALTISDSGEGMDEGTLKRAMEPFFTTKGIGKGTGLGLSMVHGFAEQSGGKFTLRSRKGEGTTAELWLPMAEADPQRADHAQRQDGEMHPNRGSLVVVAVMMTPSSSSTLVPCWRTSDMRPSPPLRANRRALDILRREDHVDVVVTDQAMPHMSGVQLALALAKEWPELPVNLATGYAEVKEGSAAGLRKLSKPFTQNELAAELAPIPRRRGTVVSFPVNGCSKA